MPRRIIRGGARAFQWWWQLPRWIKWGKLVVVLAVVLTLPMVDVLTQWLAYRSVYNQYYGHFHADYSKSMKSYEAHYYADFYADFYAKYYSNPAYRAELRNALPSATADNLTYPADSPIARHSLNARGLALIKEFEGLVLEPYTDVGGRLTIGYGHLIKPGEYFGRLQEPYAEQLLQNDVKVAEAYLKRYVKVPMNENQFSALVSLVYNIGPGNFKRSTLLEHINAGRMDKASKEILRWERVGRYRVDGLSRRRAAERELFEG